jgi:hypothetical protein
MRARVNHALVEELLDDPDLSYREIARRANCSDFSVRAISREYLMRNDTAADAEPLTLRDWFIVAGIAGLFFGGLWLLGRRLPPPDAGPM